MTTCNDVHLNPARAGLLKGKRPRLSDYRYSVERETKNQLGGRGANLEERWQPLRRGGYIGSKSFKEELTGEHQGRHLAGKHRDSFKGDEKILHDARRARDLLERGCASLGLDLETVWQRPKSAEKKMALTWRVKTNTMMTNEWISRELGMRSRTNIAGAERLFAGNSTQIQHIKRGGLQVLDAWTD